MFYADNLNTLQKSLHIHNNLRIITLVSKSLNIYTYKKKYAFLFLLQLHGYNYSYSRIIIYSVILHILLLLRIYKL